MRAFMQVARLGLAVLIALVSVSGLAVAAGAPTTPEIDGGSLAAGLGVVAAGVMMLRARRR